MRGDLYGLTRIGETGVWKGDVEVDEKCKGPRKTAKSGEVSQRYGIYFVSPTP